MLKQHIDTGVPRVKPDHLPHRVCRCGPGTAAHGARMCTLGGWAVAGVLPERPVAGIGTADVVGQVLEDVIVHRHSIESVNAQGVDQRQDAYWIITEGGHPRLTRCASRAQQRTVIPIDGVDLEIWILTPQTQERISRSCAPQRVRHRCQPPCAASV